MTQVLQQNTLLQNRYLVGPMIGKGGMGEVYLATDQRVGAPVALKRTYFLGDDVLGGGFENEAKALARLRHPALPKVTDHFVEHHDQFIVMDHVAGDDLGKRLAATQKPFPLSWVMFWADQILDALVYLQSNEPPIVHRDIKPQNLKLTDQNNIVLLDFGLSRKALAKLEGEPLQPASIAKPFAPLEQLRGTETNARSDIYSLSATLYNLLTGVVPPDAGTRADTVLGGLPDPVRPVNSFNPEVPSTISDVILKGMSVSQDQRFQDARSMQKALREAFAKMQEVSVEKTLVMGSPDAEATPVPPTPGPVADATAEQMGAATIPFAMFSQEPSPPPAEIEKTVRYTGPVDTPPAPADAQKQADIRTEVFIKPDLTAEDFPLIVTEPRVADADTGPAAFPADATMPIVNLDLAGTGPGVPDQPGGTMPIVNLEGASTVLPDAPQTGGFEDFSATNNFSAPATPFAEPVVAQETQTAPPAPVSAAVVAPAKKKTSAGLLIGILVGLFLLIVVAAGAIGGFWYYYSSGQAGFLGGSSPTPTATPTATPAPPESPTPTPDDANVSNQNAAVESPTPTPTPEPTPVPEVTPDRPSTPVTRPTLQPTPRQTQVNPSTPRPTVKPTVKPTAKPTLRGREIPQ